VTRWRLVPLALLVAALLGVVAVAAHGRPLAGGGSGRSGGPSSHFLEYVNTTAVLVIIAVSLFAIWAVVRDQSSWRAIPRGRRRPLAAVMFLALCSVVAWGLFSKTFLRRFHKWEQRLYVAHARRTKQPGTERTGSAKGGKGTGSPQLRWDEVAIVLALLGALGIAVYVAGRRRGGSLPSWQLASQAAVSAALDESLDDLRSEPDLRKAIIAAYARMERALAYAGLPRRPSEAPLEYVERALGQLETSAGAIRRLTDLFEWAKFSHHEPDPSMRDEAIDALVAVRDELRPPAAEPVAA
jgi:uncharacterized protein DUF4129